MNRFYENYILNDLNKKMVFLVGPRQSGKTWLAKKIMNKFRTHQYLNYDDFEDRKIIDNKTWPKSTELIVFDEIHKMPHWKNFLKGAFDTKPEHQKFLVTGSARLETFRSSGDSLAGRFFSYQLFPFTLNEITYNHGKAPLETVDRLISRGGFPEAYLFTDERDSLRWRNQYIDGLIRTDILDFERIHDFKAIQLVFSLLREKVSSQISYSSIARDVQISSATVKKYIEIFESLFIIFKVPPYSKKISRSILKEPKIYFYDTGLVKGDAGVKFENFMALELMALQKRKLDLEGVDAKLCYLRTKDGKEVDFCLVENEQISKIIEVKLSDKAVSKNLIYFTEKYNLQGMQIVKNLQSEFDFQNIKIRKMLE